jgi:hypothetical protein
VASHCDVAHRINTHHDQKALEQQGHLWAAASRAASPLQHYQDNTHQQAATILACAPSRHFFIKKNCFRCGAMQRKPCMHGRVGGKERQTSVWQEVLTSRCQCHNLLRRPPLVWTCALCIAAAFPCMSESCRHLSDETSAFLTDHHNHLGHPTSTGLRWAAGPLHEGGCQTTSEDEAECVRIKGEEGEAADKRVQWDLTLIESSFSACRYDIHTLCLCQQALIFPFTLTESCLSACSVPAWINDTQRFQVGENEHFSISRESCSNEGQYVPASHRERVLVFVDYRLGDVEHWRTVSALDDESVFPSSLQHYRQAISLASPCLSRPPALSLSCPPSPADLLHIQDLYQA